MRGRPATSRTPMAAQPACVGPRSRIDVVPARREIGSTCLRRWLPMLLGLASCVGSPAAKPHAVGSEALRLPVRIDFEPALTEPGRLEVAHECGERTECVAAPSGVDLRLLPGPVALTLFTGGRRFAQAMRIEIGMPPFVWHIPSP